MTAVDERPAGKAGNLERMKIRSIDMSEHNSVVGIFHSHALAEDAVREVKLNGLDVTKLSIIGRDQHTDEHVVGYYNTGDRMKYWGKRGAFWGGLWGMMVGAGFFWVPGLGPLLVAGPLVSMIVGAAEGAVVVGGLSAVGAALYGMDFPRDSILKYETAIKNGRFILVYHGTVEEVEQARQVLIRSKAAETAMHAPKTVSAA